MTIGTLLLEQAASEGRTRSDRTASTRWNRNLSSLSEKLEMLRKEGGTSTESSELVYDGY